MSQKCQDLPFSPSRCCGGFRRQRTWAALLLSFRCSIVHPLREGSERVTDDAFVAAQRSCVIPRRGLRSALPFARNRQERRACGARGSSRRRIDTRCAKAHAHLAGARIGRLDVIHPQHVARRPNGFIKCGTHGSRLQYDPSEKGSDRSLGSPAPPLTSNPGRDSAAFEIFADTHWRKSASKRQADAIGSITAGLESGAKCPLNRVPAKLSKRVADFYLRLVGVRTSPA